MGQQRAGDCQVWAKRGQGVSGPIISYPLWDWWASLGILFSPQEKRSKREQDISEGSGVQLRIAPLPFSLHLGGRASHMFKPKVKRPGEHTRAGEELGTTAQPLMGSTLNFQPVPRWAQIAVLERTEGEAVSHTQLKSCFSLRCVAHTILWVTVCVQLHIAYKTSAIILFEELYFHYSWLLNNSSVRHPFQYSCLENPHGRGAWWAPIHGVSKSWLQLSSYEPCTILCYKYTISWFTIIKGYTFIVIEYWLYSLCCTVYPCSLFYT